MTRVPRAMCAVFAAVAMAIAIAATPAAAKTVETSPIDGGSPHRGQGTELRGHRVKCFFRSERLPGLRECLV